MKRFEPDLEKRGIVLYRILKENKSYKKWMVAVWIFRVLTLLVFAGEILLLVYGLNEERVKPSDVLMMVIFTTIIFCTIPLAISVAIKTRGVFKCMWPYGIQAGGRLMLYEDRLEYIYWKTGPQSPSKYGKKLKLDRVEAFVYKIPKDRIESLEIKNDICFIKGCGNENYTQQGLNFLGEPDNPGYTLEEFSFVVAFTKADAEEKILEWVTS